MGANGMYITLTEQNFQTEVVQTPQPVLVDFWADWCRPCHALAPAIEELAADFLGKAKVGKLDVDVNPGLAAQYAIRSIPTLLFFKDGRVVDRMVGVVRKQGLAGKLNALVQKTSVPAYVGSQTLGCLLGRLRNSW